MKKLNVNQMEQAQGGMPSWLCSLLWIGFGALVGNGPGAAIGAGIAANECYE